MLGSLLSYHRTVEKNLLIWDLQSFKMEVEIIIIIYDSCSSTVKSSLKCKEARLHHHPPVLPLTMSPTLDQRLEYAAYGDRTSRSLMEKFYDEAYKKVPILKPAQGQ